MATDVEQDQISSSRAPLCFASFANDMVPLRCPAFQTASQRSQQRQPLHLRPRWRWAEDAAYVGTWASDLAQCKTPQNLELAPLVIAGDRYDQHDTHCGFKSVTGAAPAWKIKADCMVEGDAQSHDFTFTISGDALTIKDEAGTTHLLKCPE